MDACVQGAIATGHSKGAGDRTFKTNQQWDQHALRESRVSHCLGLCSHQRMLQVVREKSKLERHHG